MIAVNIMDIDVTALMVDDSLVHASEVFSEVDVEVLPVLGFEAVIVGVLTRKRLMEALKKREAAKGRGLRVADLSEKAFQKTLPGATILELREMLKRKDGAGGVVFIVDNAGRLLGRVGEAELAGRAAEYEAYGESP